MSQFSLQILFSTLFWKIHDNILLLLSADSLRIASRCLVYYEPLTPCHFVLFSSSMAQSVTEVEPYIPFNINPTGMQPLLATTILMSLPAFVARSVLHRHTFFCCLGGGDFHFTFCGDLQDI